MLGVSVGAVSRYAVHATAAGLDWERVEPLDEDALESALQLGPLVCAVRRIEPGYAWIHRERRRKGVTLQLLWKEYLEASLSKILCEEVMCRYEERN